MIYEQAFTHEHTSFYNFCSAEYMEKLRRFELKWCPVNRLRLAKQGVVPPEKRTNLKDCVCGRGRQLFSALAAYNLSFITGQEMLILIGDSDRIRHNGFDLSKLRN
jgi:hypothetical protein